MIKNTVYIFCCIVLLASCKAGKHTTQSATASQGKQAGKAAEQNELSMFYDAESARLLGKNNAFNLYSEFLVRYPNNAAAHYNIARLYFQKKELNNAIDHAKHATTLEPGNKYYQELYTQMLVYTKDTKKAESQYNSLIKKDPDNDEYLYKKAMLYVKSNNYEKAIATLDELEKKTGFNEDIIVQKKNLYQRLGKTEEAIKELQKLKEADPNAAQYVIMMADVYETGNNKAKAKEVYQELEKKYGDDPLAQVALAQYYLENNNSSEYNAFMLKVMKNKNLDVETKIALIVPSLQKLEKDSSKEKAMIMDMAKSISEQAPDNMDALTLYANVLYFDKNLDEALIQYNKILQKDKSKYDIWNQILSIYTDKQNMDSVIAVGNRSIDYFPNNPLPYFYVGISYLQKKDYGKAIPPLNKAVDLEPENPVLFAQLYSSLGDAYNSQKNYVYSDSCFEKALKIEPNDATTLNNYAYYLSLRKNKLKEAEGFSKKSLELQPNSKSFLDTYGWIFFQQGKYAEAKIYIEKAIKAGGEDDGTLYEHLGDTYYKLNELEKALENWNMAKQKGENNPLLLKKIKEKVWYEE